MNGLLPISGLRADDSCSPWSDAMTYVFALVAGLLVAAPAFGQNSKPFTTIETPKSAAQNRAPAPPRVPAEQKSKPASKRATAPATSAQPVVSDQLVASSTTAKMAERQHSETAARQEQDGSDWVSFILIVYSLPALVAYLRKHPQRRLVGVINLFLGWTFLGWVVAFAWATTTFQPVEDAIDKRLRGETRTA